MMRTVPAGMARNGPEGIPGHRPPACGTCQEFNENQAWLETVLTELDPICWTNRSASPTWSSSPAAKSQRSATGSSTSPSASPGPHVSYGSGSTRPGGGQPRSPRASTDSAPHSPDHPRPVARPEEPGDPQPGSASRPARHANNPSNPPSAALDPQTAAIRHSRKRGGLERIISEGMEREDDASTIARAVLEEIEGPKWKGQNWT